MKQQQRSAESFSDNVVLSATNEKPEHTYKRCTESELIELRLDWVIAAGVRAFPVEKGGKKPLISSNLDRATSDPKTLRRWVSEEFPGCNFGIVMGEELYCLDVDRHRPDEDGFASVGRLGGDLAPNSFFVSTPGKGVHVYFRSTRIWKTKKVGPGLDFRGGGSYCVSPWSLNEHGIYVPRGDISQRAEIPAWLLHHLEASGPARVDCSVVRRRPPAAIPSNRLIKLEKHLSRINPSLPRNDWRDVIYASLHCWGFCEEVVARLRDWSATSPDKWNPRHFESIVTSFDPARIEQLGLRTILKTKATYPVSRWSSIPVDRGCEVQVLEIASCIAREAESILTGHGNIPTEVHRTALHSVAGPLAQALYSHEGRFRKAFPLATGLGKTSLCQALCKVISDKALDKSIAIFVETVPQAGELKSGVLRLGVSPNDVGIVHSHDKYVGEVPPIKLDDAFKYRFVIACHARAKTPRVDRLLNFRGTKRDLTIWDESLIRSSAYHIDKGDAIMAAGVWSDAYGALTSAGRHSIRYAEDVEALLAFLAETRKCLNETDEGIVELPSLLGDLGVYRHLIRNVLDARKRVSIDRERTCDILVDMIEFSTRGYLRIIQADNRGPSLIQFETSIDEHFDKVFVLDASAPIRELLDYDETIEVQPLLIAKDYGSVKVRQADALSSKDSFTNDPLHLRNYLDEIAGILGGGEVPSNDEVLLVCHKQLEHAVCDFAAEVQKARTGKIHVIHWGNHRAINRYSECKWMFTIGVMYLPLDAVAAMIIGQTGSLEYSFDDGEIHRIRLSEQADALYQAVSRGHSRRTVDGKAGDQVVYLFHPKTHSSAILALLAEIMPGLIVEDYKPVYLRKETKNAHAAETIRDRIVDYLAKIRKDVLSVSIQSIAKALGYETNSRVWREGRKMAMESLRGWKQTRVHLRRIELEEA